MVALCGQQNHNDMLDGPGLFFYFTTFLSVHNVLLLSHLFFGYILNYLHPSGSTLTASFSPQSVFVLGFLFLFPSPSPPQLPPSPSSVSLLFSSISLTLSDQGRSRALHRSEEEIILHIKACKGC